MPAIAMTPTDPRRRARRNVLLAVAHALAAAAFLAVFVWYQVTH